MSHSEKQKPVFSGKTVRACDSCVRRRARWYCAADDAFLCQNCDSSIHSANPLARRHHRVRLQTPPVSKSAGLAPTWHHGFKRKMRTPRPSKAKIGRMVLPPPFVPEIETSADDGSNQEEEVEEQLLYRVPILDPVLAEFYSPPLLDDSNSEAKPVVQLSTIDTANTNTNSNDCLAGILPSDKELAEFAADMERLLGRGLDNDSFSMEELGLGDTNCTSLGKNEGDVKEELDNDMAAACDNPGDAELYEDMDLCRETLEINFDCGSPTTGEEEQEEMGSDEYQQGKKVGLRLNYEAIAVEWSVNGSSSSPWINGERPQFGSDDCWLDYMGMWGIGEVQGLTPSEMGGGHIDEGREARVSRYREKRRTRLFSKKIRYEVRKLNAEKRPRMKGRFVKRASSAAASVGPGLQY